MMDGLLEVDELSEIDERELNNLYMAKGLLGEYTEEEVLKLKRLTERYIGYGYER